jgi:hypothetical protein
VRGPVDLGLVSVAISGGVYSVTVSILALTATFARRAARRREARATLALLVPGRHSGSGFPFSGAADGGCATSAGSAAK